MPHSLNIWKLELMQYRLDAGELARVLDLCRKCTDLEITKINLSRQPPGTPGWEMIFGKMASLELSSFHLAEIGSGPVSPFPEFSYQEVLDVLWEGKDEIGVGLTILIREHDSRKSWVNMLPAHQKVCEMRSTRGS